MNYFQYKNTACSDYQNLLEIFAENEIQSFQELNISEQRELVAAWLADDKNSDEAIDFLVDLKKSGIFSELMYESLTSKKFGDSVISKLLSGDVVKSINQDMDEAFGDYLMSLDNYESDDDDDLRREDNLNRNYGLNKITHQRMGI